ncbi:MAG: hypothetical protein JGK17_10000 [Microcoleus sp. PH2017_10_PVI_O_A]|nr:MULTISPECIES: hypothetical protein [unclassified Microcoleus]MCC3405905.1 hypothetical protein [Microcoleus sp. PH2017_10_PVI_O_A]MCC3478715.1 hypothetical protein [Microcoleus sp. PH2017_12_PCY_D_A]MCC3528884.1 hypothetical protein [Microcoleus sp. PH2017_21_RUC_O_A]MCC3541062.1 hypothetical protein [Microcoleus sp. PH2017_22_RUC_O_B]
MASISKSGRDISGVLYLCGWLWGDSPGDPATRASLTAKLTAIPTKNRL